MRACAQLSMPNIRLKITPEGASISADVTPYIISIQYPKCHRVSINDWQTLDHLVDWIIFCFRFAQVLLILTYHIFAYVRADVDHNSAVKFVTDDEVANKNDQSSSATQQEKQLKRSLVESDYVNGAALAEAAPHYPDESAALGFAYGAPLPAAHPAEPIAVAQAAPLDPSIALQFAHLQHIPNPAVAVAPNLYTEAHLNDHLPLSTGYAPAFSG